MHVVDKGFVVGEIPLIPIDFKLSVSSVSAESTFGFQLFSFGTYTFQRNLMRFRLSLLSENGPTQEVLGV